MLNAIKWAIRNFFLLTTAVLAVFYLRWFHIAPISSANDSTPGLIGGIILLIICGLLAVALSRTKKIVFTGLLYLINIAFLFINVTYLNIHIPRVITTAKCNGITYYITYGAPLFDEQWTYMERTKWDGVFYESTFFGYNTSPSKIFCDTEKKEANFISSSFNNSLLYTDGENPRSYALGANAQLKNHLYFVSEDWSLEKKCNKEDSQTCGIFTYTLYECKLNYTACNPLPISYSTVDGNSIYILLKADETANEISLFEVYNGGSDGTLIFTYGKKPRCYADGCTIASK